jgi:hypothetical protein
MPAESMVDHSDLLERRLLKRHPSYGTREKSSMFPPLAPIGFPARFFPAVPFDRQCCRTKTRPGFSR